MNVGQVAMIGMWMMALGIAMVQHGKARTGKHSFWVMLTSVLIEIGLLHLGGFWG